jgi:hypothetical protein
MKWLGVRPSDLDRFNIPQQCCLPMTEEDIKGEGGAGDPFPLSGRVWDYSNVKK